MTAPHTRPFRPGNGSHGEWFRSLFCDRCTHPAEVALRERGEGCGCPIYNATTIFTTDAPEYPSEWVQDAGGGNPRCTAFTGD